MELPKHLDLESKQIISQPYLTSYAKLMCKLKNNTNEEIDFELQPTKKPYKKMVSVFSTYPKKTTPAFILEDKDYPFITHRIDASCSLPFQTGQSLSRGVTSSLAFFKFLHIEDGVIKTIETKEWVDSYTTYLKGNAVTATKCYEIVAKRKKQQLEHLACLYFKAYHQSDDQALRDRIATEYKKINPDESLPNAVFKQFFPLVTQESIPEEKIVYPNSLKKELDNSVYYLKKIQKTSSALPIEDRRIIEQTWNHLATSYENLGNYYRKNSKTSDAIYCYKESLQICDEHLNSASQKTILQEKLQALTTVTSSDLETTTPTIKPQI